MNKIKAVLIDDEYAVIGTLKSMLADHSELEVVGDADGVKAGLMLIQQTNPDLVFLDVQMKDGTGFDLLKQIKTRDFEVIFITAFDQHAVDAFRFSAIDYLLKPVTTEMLADAIAKVASVLDTDKMKMQMSVLMDNMEQMSSERKKIILKEIDAVHVVKIDDILWCTANGSYTTFHLTDGKEILVSYTLKEYETMLANCGFFRVHRSYLVNVRKISKFDKTEGGSIHLEGGEILPVSVRKKEKLMEVFSLIN